MKIIMKNYNPVNYEWLWMYDVYVFFDMQSTKCLEKSVV